MQHRPANAARRRREGAARRSRAFAPALLSLREGSLAAYHGAEHIAIGSYEHDERAREEHERCGSHLVGPLMVDDLAGRPARVTGAGTLRSRAPVAATLGAVVSATEAFGWMQRHPDRPLARALAWPGHELQHRVATAEPTPEQLQVAEAALRACLELEEFARALA